MDLDAHARLMSKLKQVSPRAVPDGPVSSARYERASPQINYLDPDVVICGGTWDFVPGAPKVGLLDRHAGRVSAARAESRTWVRMPHPGQRSWPQHELYAGLVDTLARLGDRR